MMKKVIKVTKNIICKSLLLIVLFVLLLAITSADWFLGTFGEMDFSIVVYQLFSPMEGTSSEILGKYCSECLIPVVGVTAVIMLLYIFYDIIFKKCFLKIKVEVFGKKFQLLVNRKFSVISKWIVLATGMVILISVLANKAVVLGIPEYVKEIANSSTLFEEEYVDPNEVQLVFPEQKQNLLLLYMESMEATYASVEAGGGKPVNYIPELTKLAEENLNFSDSDKLGGGHAYTSGWTMGGLLSSSTGVPYKLPVEGNSAGEYEKFLPGVTALGEILSAEGYQNYFMCGSNASFGGRKAFYLQHGNYGILDWNGAKESGVIPKDYEVYWGMEDAKLYQYARQELTEIAAGGEPFNFTMLTVDTHHPDGYICELCDNQYPEKYANAIACASKQMFEFVEWVEQQEWYENTTIVIVGDHLSMNNTFWADIGDYERSIYNCFINYPDYVKAANSNNREFSTMDMFPTVLASLGVQIEGERLGLGVNLFSDEQTLPERLGKDYFLEQLKMHSNYYFNEFVVE